MLVVLAVSLVVVVLVELVIVLVVAGVVGGVTLGVGGVGGDIDSKSTIVTESPLEVSLSQSIISLRL